MTIKIGIYFTPWFALSTSYNLQNKVRLKLLPLPGSQSAFSLFVGTAFVTPLWLTGVRKPPKLSADAVKTLMPIAFCRALFHLARIRKRDALQPRLRNGQHSSRASMHKPKGENITKST